MNRNSIATWIASCFAVVVFVAAANAGDIGGTIKSTCSTCHSVKRICMNLGYKDQAGWKATLTAMANKGAQLSPAQVDEAAVYLAGLKPGAAEVCD